LKRGGTPDLNEPQIPVWGSFISIPREILEKNS